MSWTNAPYIIKIYRDGAVIQEIAAQSYTGALAWAGAWIHNHLGTDYTIYANPER